MAPAPCLLCASHQRSYACQPGRMPDLFPWCWMCHSPDACLLPAQVQPMNPIRKYVHYVVAVITFLTGIAAAIASVRYIVVDAQVCSLHSIHPC